MISEGCTFSNSHELDTLPVVKEEDGRRESSGPTVMIAPKGFKGSLKMMIGGIALHGPPGQDALTLKAAVPLDVSGHQEIWVIGKEVQLASLSNTCESIHVH